MPCEDDEEDNEALISTISQNYVPKNIIQIEDISRETTIAQILNFAAKKIKSLGFPSMDLKMGYMQPSLVDASQNDDPAAPLSDFEDPLQVISSQELYAACNMH